MDPREPSRHLSAPELDLTRSLDEDSMVDGPLISADALHSAIRREFQTLPTYCQALLLSVLHVVYVVLSVLVAVMCILKQGDVEQCNSILQAVGGDGVIVFGKVFLWGFVLLFTICTKYHHRQARSRGYLKFYRHMQDVIHLPLVFHSGGNALLLWILASKIPKDLRTYLVLAVLAVELLVALPCLIYYTVKVVQYNTERAAPDVSQEEHSHNFSVTSVPIETGFREGSSLAEVVDKQADLIEYLKQHNTLLSRRLLNLTAQH
ncbi:transmembrane protein 192 [Periophthalmus magnuspinnatus]|uniref:transmembrane protein 192 n=1 Tax=Periophthalmus magnuspinnatus TaxID=409849 RepID=UPI00145B3A67|nr:transmembrane protein 192 [Periophthalmus magnuspinnatus]XP_055079783.1 transmembrane protein 192 [Periophthalmus magnuspinnatus]